MTTFQTNDVSQTIPSFGVDADRDSRPGVPMELDPAPVGALKQPSQQHTVVGITGTRLPGQRLTPVYGTAQPPRGLSGVMRRKANAIPPHLDSHWLLLLAADRVAAIEHHPQRLAGTALVLGGLIAGGLFLKRRR